jgi:hypothetical protein
MLVWSRARINYKFIFEFDPRNHLNFRQYFEVNLKIFFKIHEGGLNLEKPSNLKLLSLYLDPCIDVDGF